MVLRVLLASRFREEAGAKEIVKEDVGDYYLADLISELKAKLGGIFSEIMDEEGNVSDHVLLLLNGMRIKKLRDIKLRDGDVVFITLDTPGG
ncbi:MAG: hypothetical protein DRJ97_05585 [Thermoprotei archaeon]|nr:MAG: hypothetical protein DRJ97_05585 [Thermoprotei archaeon]